MQVLVYIASSWAIYSLIAVGLATIYGVLRIFHVAHAAVYTCGAYAALLLSRYTTNLWAALVVSAAAGMTVGLGIYYIAYRPLLSRPASAGFLASVGVYILIAALLALDPFLGADAHRLKLTGGLPAVTFGSVTLSSIQVTMIAVDIVALLAVGLIVGKTKVGLGWRALTADREMAGVNGVPVPRSVALNMALGSALAAIAGVLFAVYTGQVRADMGDVISYKAFIFVVLGGLGSIRGSAFAALLVATVEELVLRYAGGIFPRDAIAFAVLIVVLIARPNGLFSIAGSRSRSRYSAVAAKAGSNT